MALARTKLAPATSLARAQAVWAGAVGERIAVCAKPVSEADGVLTVACESAVWAQELDLMQADLLSRLEQEMGPDCQIRSLRFTIVSA